MFCLVRSPRIPADPHGLLRHRRTGVRAWREVGNTPSKRAVSGQHVHNLGRLVSVQGFVRFLSRKLQESRTSASARTMPECRWAMSCSPQYGREGDDLKNSGPSYAGNSGIERIRAGRRRARTEMPDSLHSLRRKRRRYRENRASRTGQPTQNIRREFSAVAAAIAAARLRVLTPRWRHPHWTPQGSNSNVFPQMSA